MSFMPHINLQGSKPIQERTGRELVWLFVVVPILLGGGLLAMIVITIRQHGGEFAWNDWAVVAWGCGLVAALLLGLPAAAWREWRRRRWIKHWGAQPDQ